MNLWPVLAVILIGAAVGLAVLAWPWLDPLSPARAGERLVALANAWAAVRDCTARLSLRRSGEGELTVRLLYLAPANVRLEMLSPEGLAGEVYALRPVPDGWLFVHHRPRLDLAVEVRLPSSEAGNLMGLPTVAQVQEGIRKGRIRVTSPAADTLDIRGFPGGFERIVLRFDPATNLPKEVQLQPVLEAVVLEVRVLELLVNTGLELRDLFTLDPLPGRWLPPVTTEPGA